MIRVESRGVVYEFTDGTPEDVIRSTIFRHQGRPVPQPGSVDSEAEALAAVQAADAANRRAQSRDPSLVGRAADVARSITQGSTANYGDEIVAGGAAAIETATDALGLTDRPGETFNDKYARYVDQERARVERFRDENPMLSPALEIAGAGATALTPVGAIGQSMRAPLSAASLGKAAGMGTLWSSLYGSGNQSGANDRLAAAVDPVNLVIGGTAGVVGNVGVAGANKAYSALQRRLAERAARNAGIKALGVSPDTYQAARTAVGDSVADAGLPQAVRTLRRGRSDAMLGDVAPNALDYYANVGAGAQTARRNLGARVDRATARTAAAVDDSLGQARGTQEVFNEISDSTRAARADAYSDFYDAPINYAQPGNVEIVDNLLNMIPDDELIPALRAANNKITKRYGKTGSSRNSRRQIDFRVNDDGSVEMLGERLSLEQLDYLKRAFRDKQESALGQFGRPTPESREYGITADTIRRTIMEVSPVDEAGVPLYQKALDAGMDKASQDEAFKFGKKLLTRAVEPEDVALEARQWGEAARQRAREGVRNYIRNKIGEVKAVRSDPNVDQRQAAEIFKELSSDNARAKMTALLGEKEAQALFRELNDAAQAFGVRAAANLNSKTEPRAAFGRSQRAAYAGEAVTTGRPRSIVDATLALPGRGYNWATGVSPQRLAARDAKVEQEMAELLTGKTGPDAMRAFIALMRANAPPPPSATSGLSEAFRRRLAATSRLAAPPLASQFIQP